ncbi:uncharacterized protein LOC143224084 [Tachypleus tridentatus]|uniref:uncharacterized protein LOC143224084 n=1 Tax=Tachypleus tridentatus TaxID=6853 RepID=UPI003FD2FE5D
MRRHWEVEKSKLQKLHAEEIEAMKENFNREFKHKKQIMEKAHIEETNKLKMISENVLENIINNLKFSCEEKSEHAEYEKQSLNDINSFELLKFQEECKSIISGEKQKVIQKCDEQLKQEIEKFHEQLLEKYKCLKESVKDKCTEIENRINTISKSVKEQLQIKYQNSLYNSEEHLLTKWIVEKFRLEEVHQDEINHLKKCF